MNKVIKSGKSYNDKSVLQLLDRYYNTGDIN